MYCILTVRHLQMVDYDEVQSGCTSDTYSFGRIFHDNIAQVLSSDFNGLKTRQRFQIKLLEIQENIDLNVA